MFSDLAVSLGSMTLSLFTGSLLLTRAWIGAVHRDRVRRQGHQEYAHRAVTSLTSADPIVPVDASSRLEGLDICQVAAAALRYLDSFAAQHGVHFEIAAQAGLKVQMTVPALRQVLEKTLCHAIEQAPGGKVIIGAMRHGGRIQLAILNDGAGVDRLVQESQLRDIIEIVALQGGTVEVIVQAGGNTIILRLPEAVEAVIPRTAHTKGDMPGLTQPQTRANNRQSIPVTAV